MLFCFFLPSTSTRTDSNSSWCVSISEVVVFFKGERRGKCLHRAFRCAIHRFQHQGQRPTHGAPGRYDHTHALERKKKERKKMTDLFLHGRVVSSDANQPCMYDTAVFSVERRVNPNPAATRTGDTKLNHHRTRISPQQKLLLLFSFF